MAQDVRIVAVGDILMWKAQIASAANAAGSYHFDSMFSAVAPALRAGDFTIGNLETTLSGRERVYERRNPKTGYPRFNCPDELASTLKRVGFNVLTTANNHCLDRGEAGLKRTLSVLDKIGIRHTGTFSSRAASNQLFVQTVKGIKIGVAAYTYGTNFISVPKDRPWLVNRISVSKMTADLQRLHEACDVVIVAMHFGQEFQRMPNSRQKQLVNVLFRNGADIVLGAHPHVLQPVSVQSVTDKWGRNRKRLVAYSLGNFISDRMMNNRYADIGTILRITVRKSDDGKVQIQKVGLSPTWVKRIRRGKGYSFKVVQTNAYTGLDEKSGLRHSLQQMHKSTLQHLKRSVR